MKAKVSLLLFAMFISLFTLANEVQTVGIGSGSTKEIATQAAMRNALENVYGIYLSSSTNISNNKIVSDKISSVSFGKILSYKELDCEKNDSGEYLVTINASVSLNKLVTFVGENTGESVKFDGAGWGFQQKMERLNKANEEKAALDIVTAIIALDVDLSSSIKILKTEHLSESDIHYFVSQGRIKGESECLRTKVEYDKKHNSNRLAIIKLVENAFKALRGPKASSYRSSYTYFCKHMLLTYIEERSTAFAITDGTGAIYPIINDCDVDIPDRRYGFIPFLDDKSVLIDRSSFLHRGRSQVRELDYKLVSYNRTSGGYNWYSLCRINKLGLYSDNNKLEINIFYTPERLENVTEITIVPLPQHIVECLKDHFLETCRNEKK